MTAVAGELLRHPVQRPLCAPVAAVAAGALVALPLLAELQPRIVVDAVPLAGLVLALATVTAAADPAGPLADATPTPGARRLVVRAVPVLLLALAGWLLAVATVPPAVRPPVPAGAAVALALATLVLAGGVVEARRRPRATEPLTAATTVAMGWAALWLLRPSWSPLTAAGVRVPALLALAAGTVALVTAGGPIGRRRRKGRGWW